MNRGGLLWQWIRNLKDQQMEAGSLFGLQLQYSY